MTTWHRGRVTFWLPGCLVALQLWPPEMAYPILSHPVFALHPATHEAHLHNSFLRQLGLVWLYGPLVN